MKVTHLYHSGILIESESHQLFFDAISDINQHIDFDKTIYFFVTHAHGDHYDPVIFSYHGDHVHYVISDEVKEHPVSNYMRVRPNERYGFDQLVVTTYKSTDSGVAFVIEFEDKVIMHAGDLNWWHWENDTLIMQDKEADDFKTIIDGITYQKFDIVCIPVDPRLGSAYHLAADYLLETKEILHLIPMHFRKQFEVCEELYQHRHRDERIVRVLKCDQLVLEL